MYGFVREGRIATPVTRSLVRNDMGERFGRIWNPPLRQTTGHCVGAGALDGPRGSPLRPVCALGTSPRGGGKRAAGGASPSPTEKEENLYRETDCHTASSRSTQRTEFASKSRRPLPRSSFPHETIRFRGDPKPLVRNRSVKQTCRWHWVPMQN